MTTSKLQSEQNLKEIQDSLLALRNDESVPRNVKSKIEVIMNNLSQDEVLSVKISKSLQILDEISEDVNIQQFIRPQLWEVTSKLEKLNQ